MDKADLLKDATYIDRRNAKRVVEMKVMVLGLSRTGTDSIRKALRIMGYRDVYHGYAAALENPADCRMWLDAFNAKYKGIGKPYGKEEFDKLLGHCEALCDVPAVCFSPELIKAYPNAKVILTHRNVDEWHSSFKNALMKEAYTWHSLIIHNLMMFFRSRNRFIGPCFLRVFSDYFGDDFENTGKQRFVEHYDEIRALVPKDQLLEYRVQEGWEPLSKFLDRPVPNTEFPNGNTIAETQAKVNNLVRSEVRRMLRNLIQISILLIFLSHHMFLALQVYELPSAAEQYYSHISGMFTPGMELTRFNETLPAAAWAGSVAEPHGSTIPRQG